MYMMASMTDSSDKVCTKRARKDSVAQEFKF